MPWSTSELAQLAAVSPRTIRHYHDVGLLPEPERRRNGYKQYDTSHLVTVLRIRRMSSLGLTLNQISGILDNPASGDDQLRVLHTELSDTINRLERARAEVANALASGLSPDITAETKAAMDALGNDPRGRNTAILVTGLLQPGYIAETLGALSASPDYFTRLDEDFAQILPDAGAAETEHLAMQIAEAVSTFLADHPQLIDSVPYDPHDDPKAAVVVDAMKTDMNPAQRLTFDRAIRELQRRIE